MTDAMTRAEFARLVGERGSGRGASWPDSEAVAEERAQVVVEEETPDGFMSRFAAALATGGHVFLADPHWGARERAQFNALLARGASAGQSGTGAHGAVMSHGWLCVPTGGSSGNLKLARHDQDTIAAAVRGFTTHFGAPRVNVVGLLPLHHVSGFMAWMRAVLTGGTYLAWDWKRLAQGGRPTLPVTPGDEPWFVSLVPTQLQRLLGDADAVEWLRGFKAVFIGGGPSWPALVEDGARLGLPLAFSYGMSETAAMVAALRPEEFARGRRGSGSALPGVSLELDREGVIAVDGPSLFRGYYPEFRRPGMWSTEDLGRIDEQGSLQVLGRRDALIISGGKKIDPLEVEAVLRASGEFLDVAVIGLPDRTWGEVVVACYPVPAAGERGPDLAVVGNVMAAQLASHKAPKRFVAVDPWPRTEQGKVNRAALRAAVEAAGTD